MNRLKLKRKNRLLSIVLAVISAAAVYFLRANTETTVNVLGFDLAYTDIFIIIASGIGGLETGLISFVLLFIAEFVGYRNGYEGLYTVVTYLLMVLITAWLAYKSYFKTIRKTLLAGVIIAAVLSLSWLLNFNLLIPQSDPNNVYYGVSIFRLFMFGIGETLFSVLVIYLYFRFMPDRIKILLGSGWIYTKDSDNYRKNFFVLSRRLTILSLVEAVFLCLIAVFITAIFASLEAGIRIDLSFLLDRWKESLRMISLMMCAAVPIVYLLNQYIVINIIDPINAMSFVMDRYFETDEKDRKGKLPDLHIHSHDEIEKLYHSLQKMVSDMSDYINRMLEQEKKSAHLTEGFMLALAKAVDAKDRYTSGHSIRVAQYSKEIAKRMGKSEKEQNEIYTMGLLHDIGKIGVPESIINKNGKLDDEEFGKIKMHPAIGYDILKNVEELPGLATGARWHHERYDGRGYPDGLSGKDIPEEARIIAVADAYDAMTSNRAYSSIRPQDVVRAEIERCKGTQFDPEIADVFLQMIDDDKDYRMREHRQNETIE